MLRALVIAAALLLPASASAAPIVGIGDQQPQMFSSPYFQRLDVPIARLIVSYDAVMLNTFEVGYVDAWLSEAGKQGIEPLIAFNHSRGCYTGEKVKRRGLCRSPSLARYARAVAAFRERYPTVRLFQPWNEVNHRAQPTFERPRLAARMYDHLKSTCPGCTVTGADLLDAGNMVRYARAFNRYAKHRVRLWGLHNYGDVNRRENNTTRKLLRAVKGDVWLTETGGVVHFADKQPYNLRRARRAMEHLFKLMRISKRIKRVYIYQWFGQARSVRWDAGIVDRFGAPRPSYRVVAKHLARSNPDPPGEPPPPPPPPPAQDPPPPPPPNDDPNCVLAPLICPGTAAFVLSTSL